MSGNDQYGRRLLLWGDAAEIFGFTFWYTDVLSSVYEISMGSGTTGTDTSFGMFVNVRNLKEPEV